MGDLALESRCTLFGVTITMALIVISLMFLPLFIYRMKKKLSIHFLINLTSAVIGIIISIPWNVQMLVDWNGESRWLSVTVAMCQIMSSKIKC